MIEVLRENITSCAGLDRSELSDNFHCKAKSRIIERSLFMVLPYSVGSWTTEKIKV